MKLLTIAQVAEILSISESTVNVLLKRGNLPHLDICTSGMGIKPRKRIREEDLERFLETRKVSEVG